MDQSGITESRWFWHWPAQWLLSNRDGINKEDYIITELFFPLEIFLSII